MSKGKTVTIIVPNIDLSLLKAQRLWLQGLRSDSPELQGLIALTDALADYASDTLGNKGGLLL